MSVLRASSPSPKSEEIAVSGRGWVWGIGRWRTESERASRVKPWVVTNGIAS